MKALGLMLLLTCAGCVGYPFDTTDQDRLLIYYTRQVAIDEQAKRLAEREAAVKVFQIQAIQLGFAYWDVDCTGRVEFKWVGQQRK